MVFQKAPFSSKNNSNGSNSKNATNKKASANITTTTTNTAVANAANARNTVSTDIYDDSGGFETRIFNNNLRNGFSGRGYYNTTSTLSSLFGLLCWMLFIHILCDVICYSHSDEFLIEDDNVDATDSVHHSKASRQNNHDYQLEKSITSHDQGETRTLKPKRRHQNRREQLKKQRPHTSHLQSAHDFDVFEQDYVDFGAVIGQNGAFSWHANYSPD